MFSPRAMQLMLALLASLPSAAIGAESAGGGGAGDPAAGRVTMQRRAPIAVLYVVPSGESTRVRRADLLKSLDERLDENTDLRAQSIEGAEECKGELACLVQTARPDYRKADPDRPYREHLDSLERSGQPWARYLLVISNFSEEGQPDRMSAVLVETDLALELFHSANREKEFWREDLEARINEEAVVARAKETEISDSATVATFVANAVSTDFRSAFERSGNWRPFGTIRLVTDRDDVQIAVDGSVIGTTRGGVTLLEQVPWGTRTLSLEGSGIEPFETRVEVERAGIVSVEPDLKRVGSASTLHDAVFWGGIAVASVGAVVTTLALVQASGEISRTVCVGVNPDCGGARWVTEDTRADAVGLVDPNPGAIPLAPLGYSLMGMGGAWSLGTEFLTDESDAPWLALGVGTALGIASYVISVALNPSNPYDNPAQN